MFENLDTIEVYRIIPIQNLEYILKNGIYYRMSANFDPDYVNIGSAEIIIRRDNIPVKCYPGTMVNEYVPFYFGVRSPMLFKIKTGHGVPQLAQDEIIYLVCSFAALTSSKLQWCFTDGNAAALITNFYTNVNDIDQLDWDSINATEWTDHDDHDRIRKKHTEFLVKDHVPVDFIRTIIVKTESKKEQIENILQLYNLNIKVLVNPESNYYYI